MGSVGPFKTLPFLRVRPSDSRPPESWTRLGGPPSLSQVTELRLPGFYPLPCCYWLKAYDVSRSVSKGAIPLLRLTKGPRDRQVFAGLPWIGLWIFPTICISISTDFAWISMDISISIYACPVYKVRPPPKNKPQTFVRIFTKYWPIFNYSRTHSVENS